MLLIRKGGFRWKNGVSLVGWIEKLKNHIEMKKYIFIVRKILTCLVVVVLFSCTKKSKGDYCWTCRVGEGAQMRTVDTCTVESNPKFGWEDANGNDLNHFCEKK